MSNNVDLFDSIAIRTPIEARTFEADGKSITLHLMRWREVGDTVLWQRAIEGRETRMKAQKGRMSVILEPELAEKFAPVLRDSKPLDGGKAEIYVTSKEEIFTASLIEYGVVDPETGERRFTWPEAVLFGKLNWRITGEVIEALQKMNGLEAKQAAKKGSTETTSEAGSDES